MTYRLTIECDLQHLDREDVSGYATCHTAHGDNPSLATNHASNVQVLPAKVAELARWKGWKRQRGQWVCPGCQNAR